MLNTYRKALLPFLTVGVLLMSTAVLTGCDEKGPAEQAGEKIDEGLNDASRAVKDAAD